MNPWIAFTVGLAGSLHCAAMCGPLVLALDRARGRGRIADRLLHHLGRVTMYGALGLLFGAVGQVVALGGLQRWLSIVLGLALVAAWLGVGTKVGAAWAFRVVHALHHRLRPWLNWDGLRAHAITGALNGLLPCGLVYLAAAGATVAGSAVAGAACMLAFGIGTLPVMLAVHFAGRRVTLPRGISPATVTRLAMLAMAALLILRGLDLGIPYLSPALPGASDAGVRCH